MGVHVKMVSENVWFQRELELERARYAVQQETPAETNINESSVRFADERRMLDAARAANASAAAAQLLDLTAAAQAESQVRDGRRSWGGR